jgi:hypothetical protein
MMVHKVRNYFAVPGKVLKCSGFYKRSSADGKVVIDGRLLNFKKDWPFYTFASVLRRKSDRKEHSETKY